MRNNKFTNKEEYLQYRKDWKETYKKLSFDIKYTKYVYRLLQSKFYGNKELTEKQVTDINKFVTTRLSKIDYIEDDRIKDLSYYNRFPILYVTRSIWKLKLVASGMLNELKLAKLEASEQYNKESLLLVDTK